MINVILGYLSEAGRYTLLLRPEQLFLAVCPNIAGRLGRRGMMLLLAAVALSLLHFRWFHILLPFVLLYAKLPGYHEDRGFWSVVILFGGVIVLWVALQIPLLPNWRTI